MAWNTPCHAVRFSGTSSKIAVAEARDRRTNRISAELVESATKRELQGFVARRIELGVDYTVELASHCCLPNHHAVSHGLGK